MTRKATIYKELQIEGRVLAVPVRLLLNDSRQCRTVIDHTCTVLARNAMQAANWARDMLNFRPETEIIAYGPRGGQIKRFIGWEEAIGSQMLGRAVPEEEKVRRLRVLLLSTTPIEECLIPYQKKGEEV